VETCVATLADVVDAEELSFTGSAAFATVGAEDKDWGVVAAVDAVAVVAAGVDNGALCAEVIFPPGF
jgi:hypothetical protein